MNRYRIQYTGILGDQWLGGEIYTDLSKARSFVRFLNTSTIRFDPGQRAAYKIAKVVPA